MCDRRSLRSAFIRASILFTVALVAISLIPQEAQAVLPLPGDTNADGLVNGDDIGAFVAAVVGGSGDPCVIQAADVDLSGTLDTADVDLFVQFLLGKADPAIYLLQPRPFLIGPFAGLTTAWHPAPSSTKMPLGETVQLEISDLMPGDSVTWTGATETASDPTYSRAECVLTQTGTHTVEVVLTDALACESRASLECIVVDLAVADITCSVEVSVPPLLVDENSSNETTMSYFFPISRSNAQLRQVGPGQYRTSVARELTFTAQTQPTGFEPLMEWRRDGQVLGLGQTLADHVINSPGTYAFTAGPAAQPEAIQIDTYSVAITSHTSFVDIVPEGQSVTFTAVTDPPGYEADITWIASTKYGTGTPVLGSGPSFVVQFDNAVGPDGFQWLGVRADNAAFVQDQTCDCPDDADDEAGGQWNGNANCKIKNNCYNYALNKKSNTYAQPGQDPNPIPDADITCVKIAMKAEGDGGTRNGNSTDCPDGECLVALFVNANNDYHWYRKNDDGTWSHKMGGTKARTTDESSPPQEIGNDIRAAGVDTAGYVFCEYMCFPWDTDPDGLIPREGGGRGVGAFLDVQILNRSGTANPGWDLTDPDDIATIQAALAGLTPTADPNWINRLGQFNGFAILGRTDIGLPEALRVWNGVIEFANGSTATYFLDDNNLESFLTQEAIARGLGGELTP